MFKNTQSENLTSVIYVGQYLFWMVDICSVHLSTLTKKLILKLFIFTHSWLLLMLT